MNHRYTLEPYNGRHSRTLCPKCGHSRRTFKRYIDTETNTYLADPVGRCDRVDSCGYHYPPRKFFADLLHASAFGIFGYDFSKHSTPATPPTPRFDTLPRHYVTDTTKGYRRNNFIIFLIQCFDEATALRLAALYKIGTSKYWPGATIFWQIDVNDNVRTGKIMLYNPADGHRVKQPYNHITWAHGLVGSGQLSVGKAANYKPATANFKLQQCFFGEHLLNTHLFKTVAIAESEKTAIICSFIYPEYIWLAAGSLEGLNRNKCKVLKNRTVILFPDLNGFDKWKIKAREMNLRIPTANFTVDDTLERTVTPEERAHGLDMADRWIAQILNKLKVVS